MANIQCHRSVAAAMTTMMTMTMMTTRAMMMMMMALAESRYKSDPVKSAFLWRQAMHFPTKG